MSTDCNRRIVIVLIAAYLPLWGSVISASEPVQVDVKFITTSGRPVTACFNDETDSRQVFGLRDQAVLYTSLPDDEITDIELTETDIEDIEQAGSGGRAARAICRVGRICSTALLTLCPLSFLLAKKASSLVQDQRAAKFLSYIFWSLENGLEYVGQPDLGGFFESISKELPPADYIESGLAAQYRMKTMIYGGVSLGMLGVECLLRNRDRVRKHHLAIRPREIAGYEEGMQIVVNVTKDHRVEVKARRPPRMTSKVISALWSKSLCPQICLFTDPEGDVCGVTVNRGQMSKARVNLSAVKSEVIVSDIINYDRSLTARCMSLAKMGTVAACFVGGIQSLSVVGTVVAAGILCHDFLSIGEDIYNTVRSYRRNNKLLFAVSNGNVTTGEAADHVFVSEQEIQVCSPDGTNALLVYRDAGSGE